MAQKPKPDNVVPFRSPGGERKPRELPKWVPKELVGTVTGWIVLANVAVWIAMIVVSRGRGIFSRFDPETTFSFGSLVPEMIGAQPWRMISSTFVHADIGHIAMNMAILWFTGRQLERAYGRGRFAALYFAASFSGSVFSLVWHLLASPGTSVGASGGVLGVVAALAAFFWRATGRHSDHTRQWLWFCGLGIIGGLVTSTFGMPVDNAAHIGGMTGGFLLSYFGFAGRPSWKPGLANLAIALVLLSGGASVAASIATSGSAIARVPVDESTKAFERGATAFAARDFATAEKELQIAIEGETVQQPMIRAMRARALHELKRNEEAIAELDAADRGFQGWREREPGNAFVSLAYASMLLEAGRFADGEKVLIEATKERAPDGTTFARIAELLEELDKLEEARLAAAKARIAEPRNELHKLLHQRINEKIAVRQSGNTPAPPPEASPTPT